jgi:hypothetical protein
MAKKRDNPLPECTNIRVLIGDAEILIDEDTVTKIEGGEWIVNRSATLLNLKELAKVNAGQNTKPKQ